MPVEKGNIMHSAEEKKGLLRKISGRFFALMDWIAGGHKKKPLCKT